MEYGRLQKVFSEWEQVWESENKAMLIKINGQQKRTNIFRLGPDVGWVPLSRTGGLEAIACHISNGDIQSFSDEDVLDSSSWFLKIFKIPVDEVHMIFENI